MIRRFFCALAALSACATCCVGSIPAAHAAAHARAGATCPGSRAGCVRAVLDLVNAERAGAGLPPLTLVTRQSRGTRSCVGSFGHSVAMAMSGTIWHTDPQFPRASFPNDICIRHTIMGENAGYYPRVQEFPGLVGIHRLMMSEPHSRAFCRRSDSHACNILRPSFHHVGIGVYYSGGTIWLTEDFTN